MILLNQMQYNIEKNVFILLVILKIFFIKPTLYSFILFYFPLFYFIYLFKKKNKQFFWITTDYVSSQKKKYMIQISLKFSVNSAPYVWKQVIRLRSSTQYTELLLCYICTLQLAVVHPGIIKRSAHPFVLLTHNLSETHLGPIYQGNFPGLRSRLNKFGELAFVCFLFQQESLRLQL